VRAGNGGGKPRRLPREASGPSPSPSPADSLGSIGPGQALRELSRHHVRRLTFVVLFRVILISLVLGLSTVLYWLADADLTASASIVVFAVIGVTYLLTIGYSLMLRSGRHQGALVTTQLLGDLMIAAVIVHATGGPQSAYTFFFPLAIIGAALISTRRATVAVSVAALLLFLTVSLLGWSGLLPGLSGQALPPTSLTRIELARALALNGAAIVGVALLAINLGSQLQATRTSLVTQTSAAADLLTLHSDIVRSLPSGLVTIDLESRINSLNETAARILGVRGSAVLGRPLDQVMEPLATELAELGDKDRLHRSEIQLPGDGGLLVLGVSVSPLVDRNQSAIGRVINFQDLTELRRMEQQVRRAERLAVIGGLAAGVAHEIRNPLASISGSIELLRSSPPDSDETGALMDIVTREIDRLNELITELLDYTNPRPPTKVALDLAEVVRATAGAFSKDRDFADVALAVEITAPGGHLELDADPEKLRQVMWNLLRNAAQAAMEGGGSVEVRVSLAGERAIVEVADDGPGIASEDVDRIFDPFFTTKEHGTGLGLAIVHNIVLEHRGSISARRRPRGGTVFRLELPYTSLMNEAPR
jgi:two-component system sensor histidine kinase PilS (NtrC family)